MWLLILRDLQYRKWRVGLTIGVVAQGTGGPFTSPQPVDTTRFDSIQGEPVLVAPSAINGARISLVARSYDSLSEPVLTAGNYPSTTGDVLIDESSGYLIGDTIEIGGLPGTVVGLTDDATILAGVPVAFVTLEFGRETAVGGRDLLLGKLTSEANPTLTPDLKLLTPEMVGDDALLPLDGAIASVTLVRALLWLITVIIIAAIIYITALERTRDFAVLKAVGAKTRDLGSSLLVQGVLMTLLAVLVAGILQTVIAPSFPLKVRVPSSAWLTIGGGAAVAALVAGAAGVAKVRSTSPAEAFG